MQDPSWPEAAACRGVDTELFYSEEEADDQFVLALCARCPVRQPCLQWAMSAGEAFGVWGGTTERERRRILRRQRRQRSPHAA